MSFAYVETGRSPLAFRLKELDVFFSDKRCLEVIQTVPDEKGSTRYCHDFDQYL